MKTGGDSDEDSLFDEDDESDDEESDEGEDTAPPIQLYNAPNITYCTVTPLPLHQMVMVGQS